MECLEIKKHTFVIVAFQLKKSKFVPDVSHLLLCQKVFKDCTNLIV